MGIVSDMAREDLTRFLCKKLVEKIEKYPEAAEALREVGNEMLEDLPNVPEWALKYYRLFRE